MKERKYVAIDLKSFFASVECVERKLDPLTTNLVVADASRTEKTICLAVTPSLKSYGIKGRARLFEVVQRVREVNKLRMGNKPAEYFTKSSYDSKEINADPECMVDYIVAPPRMSYYMDYSTRIYDIYLKYVSHEDMHVYSIDEVFIDVTDYLETYKMTARELALRMIQDVLKETGITATAGIGTNLYLCKIAMDIVAKKMPADKDGVRIAELDEMSYRRELWDHEPLTDFWRVGNGYSKKLIANGMRTMGDVARCSLGGINDYHNEDLLYKLFGINAEFLIDHAWGYEPCTIKAIKECRPERKSLSTGQVLPKPYTFEMAKIIVREMTELLVLDLVDKGLVTDQIVLTVLYDVENLTRPEISEQYEGEVSVDYYGRLAPSHAHGTGNIGRYTSSTRLIVDTTMKLYEEIVDHRLLVRKIYVVANRVKDEKNIETAGEYEQLSLFTDTEAVMKEQEELAKEKRIQQAVLSLQKRYGKNAVLKGMNLYEDATTIERNATIGGHKA